MERVHKNIQYDLCDDIICIIAIIAIIAICIITVIGDDATLCFKFDQASDLLQQQELASELESDL